jgi:hypothetical protein
MKRRIFLCKNSKSTTVCLTHLSLNEFCSFFQFRRSVSDVLKPNHDDHFLLRWLRARQWNPENAEKMLREVQNIINCF